MKLIKLFADWCGPCKVLEKTLQDHNIEHRSVYIDSPEGDALVLKHGIKSIPTLLVLDDEDNLVRKMSGLPASTEDLMKFIHEQDS